MPDSIQWAASATGILAAIMVAANLSSRVTGIGFLIFTVSSIGWIAFAVMVKVAPLAIQNCVLLLVNLFGAYRYLIVKTPKAG